MVIVVARTGMAIVDGNQRNAVVVDRQNGSELQWLIQNANQDDSLWQAALTRLESHPRDAVLLDRRGRSPYMALAAVADDRALSLQLLAKLHKRLGLSCLTARDKTGLTALMIAFQAGASRRFLQALLRRNGREQILSCNHQGNLPIHLLLERNERASAVCFKLNNLPFDRQELIDLMLQMAGADEQLLHENNKGETPLHVCLNHKLDENFVVRLAQACPKALRKHVACGYTPLMAAIEENYPADLLRRLVELDPHTTTIPNKGGKYPLRRCLEQRRHIQDLVSLLCTCPEAVNSVDMFGRNAVQLVLEQWCSSTSLIDPQILQILFAQSPGIAIQESTREHSTYTFDKADTPIRLCYKPYGIAQAELERVNRNASSPMQRQKARRLVQIWWDTCHVVLRALDENILWAALRTSAPVSVIGRILREYPSLIHTENTDGNLPLHWVCRHRRHGKNELFDVLMDADPEQAAQLSRNGQLPLHLCVQSGILLSPCRLSRLLLACPAAMSIRDPWSGMYPFALAASSCYPRFDDDPKRECCQLDQLFTLVSMAPGLLLIVPNKK